MSRLIKSGWTSSEKEDNKVISIKLFKEEKQNLESLSNSTSILEERTGLVELAQKEAEAILNEAQQYASSLKAQLTKEKADWVDEKNVLVNQAKESGFEEGFKEGQQKGYSEFLEKIEEARQVVESSRRDYFKKLESSEGTILELGLKVAEKIISEHIEGDSERFISIVKRVLKEAREFNEIQLHVNPVHYDFLLAQKQDLMKVFPKETTELFIFPDADLSHQSCIIESANGRIDASFDQQLAEVKRKLFELLESE